MDNPFSYASVISQIPDCSKAERKYREFTRIPAENLKQEQKIVLLRGK